MKLTREIKIGMVVVFSFLILLWGMNFLKGRDLFLAGNKYYGVYSRVDGLTDASPIYYQGFKVGTVRNIEIHPTNPKQFLVTFTITEKVAFPDNTIAELYSLDIMGAKAISIKPGDSQRSLSPGDTLISMFRTDFVDQMSDQMLPLKEKTESLIVRLDSSLIRAGTFLDADTKKYFDASMRDMSITMNNMADITSQLKEQMSRGGDIQMIVEHVNQLTEMLNSKREQLGQTIDNFSELSGTLADGRLEQSMHALDSTVNTLRATLDGLNRGEGTLGMALKDEALYENMTLATNNLNKILLDFKANPKRYVSFSAISFGKKVSLNDVAEQGIQFFVALQSSPQPIQFPNRNVIAGQKVHENYDGKIYSYWSGAFETYPLAQQFFESVKGDYPDATIFAKEDGQNISLEKAIRKSK
ncbi:MAG: MCE family protein [Marinilabiliaceae bacterium]|nr:MCE family protein [Marinilabiliaceae bacterium]